MIVIDKSADIAYTVDKITLAERKLSGLCLVCGSDPITNVIDRGYSINMHDHKMLCNYHFNVGYMLLSDTETLTYRRLPTVGM